MSPHIEINLVEGDEESVKIENAKVSEDNIKIEMVGKTLRIYLEDANKATTSEKVEQSNGTWKKSIWHRTMMTVIT